MKAIVLIVFMGCSLAAAAQPPRHSSLGLAYDDVSVGRNINITYRKPWGRSWLVYAGLKYHINSKYYKNDYSLKTSLYKELYAKESLEHFGLKAGVEKTVWVLNGYTALLAYYDFQFTHATGKTVNQVWAPSLSPKFPELSPLLPPPYSQGITTYSTYESIFGLGAHIRVNDKAALSIKGGIGINHIQITAVDFKPDHWPVKHPASFVFTRQFSFGLHYALRAQAGKASRQKVRDPLPIGANSINLSYDDVQTGRHLSIGYRHALPGGFALYGAVKYHINTRFYRDYSITEPYYFKQFRPEGFWEHLGLTMGVEKSFRLAGSNVEPFAFYELQVMRATVSNLVDLDFFASGRSRPIDNAPFFAQEIENQAWFRKYGPVLALENYAGLGARLKVSDKVNFKIKAGLGYNFYIGPDHFQDYETNGGNLLPPIRHEGVAWTAQKSELSRMFSLGLEYKLK